LAAGTHDDQAARDAGDRAAAAEQQLRDMEAKVARLEVEGSARARDLDAQRAAAAASGDLAGALEAQALKLSAVERDLQAARQELAQAAEDKQRAAARAQAAKEAAGQAAFEKSQLETRLASLQRQLDSAQKDLELRTEQTRQREQAAAASTQRAADQLQRVRAEHARELEDVQGKVRSLQTQVRELTQAREAMEQHAAAARRELAAAREMLGGAESQQSAAQRDIAEFESRARADALEAARERDQLEATIRTLKLELVDALRLLEDRALENERLASAAKENMALSHAMMLQNEKRALMEQNQQMSDLQQLNEGVRSKLAR
jgi:chromosome segregation ATPase